MPLDTVYKAHAYITREGNGTLSVADPFLALPRDSATAAARAARESPHTSSWAVYLAVDATAALPAAPPPGATGVSREFDFMNRIRADLGVNNITIHGGGTMGALRADIIDASGWSDPATWDDATIGDWFRFQGLFHAAANIPRLPHAWPAANCSLYTRDYCYGSCYTEGYESAATDAYDQMLTRAAKVAGNAHALLYVHPFLSSEPGAWDKYPADTRILNSDGSQMCYDKCQSACMWFGRLEPSTATGVNGYGGELLRYVDKAMLEHGFGGLYIDESIYSTSPRNFNPLAWDGVSGNIDPAMNGTVTRTFADTTVIVSVTLRCHLLFLLLFSPSFQSRPPGCTGTFDPRLCDQSGSSSPASALVGIPGLVGVAQACHVRPDRGPRRPDNCKLRTRFGRDHRCRGACWDPGDGQLCGDWLSDQPAAVGPALHPDLARETARPPGKAERRGSAVRQCHRLAGLESIRRARLWQPCVHVRSDGAERHRVAGSGHPDQRHGPHFPDHAADPRPRVHRWLRAGSHQDPGHFRASELRALRGEAGASDGVGVGGTVRQGVRSSRLANCRASARTDAGKRSGHWQQRQGRVRCRCP